MVRETKYNDLMKPNCMPNGRPHRRRATPKNDHLISPRRVRRRFSKEATIVLFHGDAAEFLGTISDKTVSLVVTSSPHNIGKVYEQRMALDQYLTRQWRVISQFHRGVVASEHRSPRGVPPLAGADLAGSRREGGRARRGARQLVASSPRPPSRLVRGRREAGDAMFLVEPNQGTPIPGIQIPKDFYWVLSPPAPLAGMRYPWPGLPWSRLSEVGFSDVVSLDQARYDPTPLTLSFSCRLQDLVGGGPPWDPAEEEKLIKRAVEVTVSALQSGHGVLVHCVGGRGRTGTVLACSLRQLGFGAEEIIPYLDRVHKARGKPGWPESPWQSALVHDWNPAV